MCFCGISSVTPEFCVQKLGQKSGVVVNLLSEHSLIGVRS